MKFCHFNGVWATVFTHFTKKYLHKAQKVQFLTQNPPKTTRPTCIIRREPLIYSQSDSIAANHARQYFISITPSHHDMYDIA